jgi:mitochondrial fission protein ELM1
MEAGNASQPPPIWVLTGHKAGDNTQVLAVAEALGWPFEVKRFKYRAYELLSNRLLGVTLAGIDKTSSSRLEPPWPAVVITAGRRNEPVARWIRKQAGGRTRLVHIGRPWAPLDCFDLIVVTPQYFVPRQSNVLYIDLPLHRLDRIALDDAREKWHQHFTHLPRPYWTVLLGGDSGPFVFTEEKALRLVRWLNQVAKQSRGSVLLSNSARTPPQAYETIVSGLEVPSYVFRWGSVGVENPYLGYLAVADNLVVTGESMSMLAESSATGKPLYIFDLSDCPHQGDNASPDCRPWWGYLHNYRYKPLSHHLAMLLGPARMKRDVSRIQARLIATGGAVWTGQQWAGRNAPAERGEINTVVTRIKSLLEADR